MDKEKESLEKIENFRDILDGLKNASKGKKALWREIYENAISDRERASILFTEAFKSMAGGPSEHAVLGTTLVKYLERMCKSNDQILSLADLISKAETAESNISSDDLFSKISSE